MRQVGLYAELVGGEESLLQYHKLVGVALLALGFISCSRDPDQQKQRFVEIGNKYYAREEYEEADILYRKALQVDQRFAEAHYRLGLTNLKQGDIASAASALRRASELAPDNRDAFLQLAELYLAALSVPVSVNRDAILSDLIQLSERAQQENPGTFEILYIEGRTLHIQKDYQGAIETLEAALLAKPSEVRATLALALVFIDAGQPDRSEALARDYLDAHQSEDSAQAAMEFLYRLYAAQGRLPEAEAMLRSKCERFPDGIQNWIELAAFYQFTRRPEQADQSIQEMFSEIGDDAPAVYLRAGDFYSIAGRADTAAEYFRKGAQLDQKNETDFLVRIASAYATAGQPEKALVELAAVLEKEPTKPEALGVRGLLKWNSRDPNVLDSALEDMRVALSRLPRNHRLRVEYAKALVASGDLTAAESQLEEALRIDPKYPPAYHGMVDVSLQRGEFPRAKALTSDILKENPLDFNASLALAVAQIGLREFAEARLMLADLIAKGQRPKDANYYLAVLDAVEGRTSQAEQRFRSLAETEPSDPRILRGLLGILQSQNRTADALAVVDAALSRQPNDLGLRLTAAQLSLSSNRADDAVEHLGVVLAQRPRHSTAHVLLGRTLLARGDREGAKRHIYEAINGEPPLADAFFDYGSILALEGQYAESRSHFERCLEIQPDHRRALNNLAFVLAEIGTDLELAFTYAQRAIARDPQNADFKDTLAYVYIKRDLNQDAVNLLTPIVAAHPARADFRYHLGLAHYQNGDIERARTVLQSVPLDRLRPENATHVGQLLAELGG